MGVEMIENHAHPLGLRVALVHEPLHLGSKVRLGAPLRDGPMSPPRLRLTENQQLPAARAFIRVIRALPMGWASR